MRLLWGRQMYQMTDKKRQAMHVTSSRELDTTNKGRVVCDTLLPGAEWAPQHREETQTKQTKEEYLNKNSTQTDPFNQSLQKSCIMDLLLLHFCLFSVSRLRTRRQQSEKAGLNFSFQFTAKLNIKNWISKSSISWLFLTKGVLKKTT